MIDNAFSFYGIFITLEGNQDMCEASEALRVMLRWDFSFWSYCPRLLKGRHPCTLSNKNLSKDSSPIFTKFYICHHWDEGKAALIELRFYGSVKQLRPCRAVSLHNHIFPGQA